MNIPLNNLYGIVTCSVSELLNTLRNTLITDTDLWG